MAILIRDYQDLNTLPQLVTALSRKNQQHSHRIRRELKELKNEKCKIRKSLADHSLQQSPIITNRRLSYFNKYSFIDIEEPYVEYKVKRQLLLPDRAKQTSPNPAIGLDGKYLFDPQQITQDDRRRILNMKFLQYNRVIDMQDPLIKKSRLRQTIIRPNIKISAPRQQFSPIQGDRFHFYDTSRFKQSISTRRTIKSKTQPTADWSTDYSPIKTLN